MKIRTIAMALAVAGTPALLAAQQGTPPVQGQRARPQLDSRGMRGHADGRFPLRALINRRQQLNLTDAQVQRLTAIQQRLESQNRPLMERLRAQRQQAGLPEMRRPQQGERGQAARGRRQGERRQRPQLTEQQRQALTRFREQSQPLRQQIQQNVQAAARDARAVLTEQQRQQVQQLMERRGRRGGRRDGQGRRNRGEHHGQRGQHQHQGHGQQSAPRP
jgi:hypothetical protein